MVSVIASLSALQNPGGSFVVSVKITEPPVMSDAEGL